MELPISGKLKVCCIFYCKITFCKDTLTQSHTCQHLKISMGRLRVSCYANSNTHEIMNETRKTNFHDFISTSQHLNYLYIPCKRPCAIIHHQSAQNRLYSLYQVITPLENFKYLIPIFLPY